MSVREALEHLQEAQAAEREARRALVLAVQRERKAGRSLAEIAADLGVSRQRVQQLSKL